MRLRSCQEYMDRFSRAGPLHGFPAFSPAEISRSCRTQETNDNELRTAGKAARRLGHFHAGSTGTGLVARIVTAVAEQRMLSTHMDNKLLIERLR